MIEVAALEHLGARTASSGPFLGNQSEVSIGQQVALLDASSRVLGDSLFVRQGATVYNPGYNELTNNGTIRVSGVQTLAGLETTANTGLIDLLDGATDDRLTLPGAYSGTGGARLGVDVAALREPWLEHVGATLEEATLQQPKSSWAQRGGKRGVHSEHLGYLLAEMQFLQRAYPGATW